MAEKEKFWTKVKVGVVVALVATIIEEIFTGGWFISTLLKVVKAIGGFLNYPIPLPLWAVLLLPFVGAGVVIGWKALARRRNRSAEDEYRAYTSARILDVDWEWEWARGGLNVIALCPKCSNQLYLEDDPAGYAYGVIGASVPCMVKCEHCGFKKQFGMTAVEVLKMRDKEIVRRFRRGEYKIMKRLWSKLKDH